jgi:hypothetical protein
MLFISGLMLFVRRSKPFCPTFGPIGKPPSECGTVGDDLILFVRGLMLFIRDPLPSESHQMIVAWLVVV